MEFSEKLQELRKKKKLTQEALAEAIFVSRTAVSKWEQGRGYPSIDSLKAIAKFFGVTIDELLSGDALLTIAEEETKEKQTHIRDLVFGLLDCGVAMFFFLPFFGQRSDGTVASVSLFYLAGISPWLQWTYILAIAGTVVWGILTLALQNCENVFWMRSKCWISLVLNAAGVLLFMASLQPYAAALLFLFLGIKAILVGKRL